MPAVATAVLLLLSTPAWAGPRDGAWWMGAPESFKLGYVAGYLAGREEQGLKWSRLTDEAAAQLPADARAQFSPVLDALRAETGSFAQASYGDVVAQLDGFYHPEKNRTIPLEQAFTIVRQALNGADQPYLYCQIEYFRLAHDQSQPMKERIEALGKKAAECAEMNPHLDTRPPDGVDEYHGLPESHPPPQ
jgi:hypothetical protein